jgi:hypothetical protein
LWYATGPDFNAREVAAARRPQTVVWGKSVADRYTFEEPAMQDQFDITLDDGDLLGEVELTTDLMIAATESDLPLSAGEIDRLLGIDRGVES